jgi:hypothetical protein
MCTVGMLIVFSEPFTQSVTDLYIASIMLCKRLPFEGSVAFVTALLFIRRV